MKLIQQQSINFYKEGGRINLETRALEIKNNVLKAKKLQSTLNDITQDFEQLKAENKILLKKLRNQQGMR